MVLKCPYCPEIRPSRSRLDNHINQAHGATLAAAAHSAALDAVDERMLKCPYCTETRAFRAQLQTHVDKIHYFADTQPRRAAAVAAAKPVSPYPPMAVVEATFTDIDPKVMSVMAGEAEPGPTRQQRDDLNSELVRVGQGLDKAGQEMRDMRAALDAVDERMRKLDAELTKPSVVRRATLNQVWDHLLDAGQLAAAREVMKMIERLTD